MSILLEGVNSPKTCSECLYKNYFAFINCTLFLEMGEQITKKKHCNCPLKEIENNIKKEV
jgi:hypothetical protein